MPRLQTAVMLSGDFTSELDGKTLEEIKEYCDTILNKHAGKINSIYVNTEDSWDSSNLQLWGKRLETDTEYESRMKNAQIREDREKEKRRFEYSELKKEFEVDG